MSSLSLLWVIIGDFNAMVPLDERKDGPHHYYACKAICFLISLLPTIFWRLITVGLITLGVIISWALLGRGLD